MTVSVMPCLHVEASLYQEVQIHENESALVGVMYGVWVAGASLDHTQTQTQTQTCDYCYV